MTDVANALKAGRPAGLTLPAWVTAAPYEGSQHPAAGALRPIEDGANCQRYAYAVLGLLGVEMPPHRSSDLWDDPSFAHADWPTRRDVDLALFNSDARPWGAHVGIVLGDEVLHLCKEVGRPVVWPIEEFASRPRYACLVGLVRPRPARR